MNHSLLYQFAVFFGSLGLIAVSAYVLTVQVEKTGARLGFSEGLLGLITALGADSPEIASAVTAITGGHHELGVGVILGSNIFNFAALLGLSTLFVGVLQPGREGLLLDSVVAMLITLIGAALIGRWLIPWLGAVLIGLLLVPYVALLSINPAKIRRLKVPGAVQSFLERALAEGGNRSKTGTTVPKATAIDMLSLLPTLFAIIAGSRGLVGSALSLAAAFNIHHAVVGIVGLAALTGIPNAIAAVRLALRGRGAAVVTECFNSNSLNIVVGICLPALIIGLNRVSPTGVFALWVLAGMTALSIVLTLWRKGLRRIGASILVGLYLAFLTTVLLWKAS